MAQGSKRGSRGSDNYDVAIVGAGPAGCVTALAFAERGAKVLLLEANPQSSRRLAGEWIHPPAVDILKRFGVEPRPVAPFLGGRGFVLFPDDGSRPVVLPYATGTFAYSFEHSSLVDTLREHCNANRLIDYKPYARATELGEQRITYQIESGGSHVAAADLLVGASGRMSVAHTALGIRRSAGTYSRMAGLVLRNVEMPFEGYGHVCLGGLGPILAYRIDANMVRVQLDVPLSLRLRRDRQAVLYEAYAPALPEQLRPAFREALHSGGLMWATNQIRPRVEFGREGLALVGDAVGYHHPLTAVGMTMGFQDAVALANAKSFAAYRRERILRSRVPEMLAVALYEIFADTSDEVVAIRRAIYDLWRKDSFERFQTMRFLGCQDTNPVAFGTSFYKAVLLAGKSLVGRGMSTGKWDHVRDVSADLADRSRWLLAGALHLRAATPVALGSKNVPGDTDQTGSADERYGAALRASSAKADVVELPFDLGRAGMRTPSPAVALERGTRALVALQDADGSWEGEIVASPALAAQYVIAAHLMGQTIEAPRRRRLRLHFERSRVDSPAGRLWGLAPGGGSRAGTPDVSVTALVYVALRMLDVSSDDSLLVDAAAYVRAAGGLASTPCWAGRTELSPHAALWLAMTGLSGWSDVSPMAPELWSMPKWMPTHPARYALEERMLYLGLAALFGSGFRASESALSAAIRSELGANQAARRARPIANKAVALFERVVLGKSANQAGTAFASRGSSSVVGGGRDAAITRVRATIRDLLASSGHAGLTPTGMLIHALALHAEIPGDPDAKKAFDQVAAFIWEDEVDGARVAPARTSVADTALAMRTLVAIAAHGGVQKPIERADRFLGAQQLRASADGSVREGAIDPDGGFSLAGAWHRFPVSAATAEALDSRLTAADAGVLAWPMPERELEAGVRFVLRAQNADGGFADHAPRASKAPGEWLMPAASWGMVEAPSSSVETTASCVVLLAHARALAARSPQSHASHLDLPIENAMRKLREAQLSSGAWPGARGVRLLYGTLFAVRGLLAGGARVTDPQLRKACSFVKAQQRSDGSWGEMPSSQRVPASDSGVYLPSADGHVTQTAWALTTLLEAEDADWDAIDRAAHWLASAQLGSGEWPRQEPSGITSGSLSESSFAKTCFALRALAEYEARRKRRSSLYDHAGAEPTAAE